jgi:hypothetical protein
MRIAGYVKFAALVVIGTSIVAVATPQHTSVALRVAVFLFAAAGAVALIDLTRHRCPPAEASPFEPARVRAPKPSPPADLVRFALETRALDAASRHGEIPTVVPASLRRSLRAIAASRLDVHRGPALGEPLQSAIDGEPVTVDAEALVAALERL